MNKKADIVIYNNKIEVKLEKETLWLTQKQIAELFDIQRPAVTKHLSNIFKTKELEKASVCSILEHTAEDGKVYKTQFYNLDLIISVGYRVNSKKGTQFRVWATGVLKQHLTQGYTVNEKRLKESNDKYLELQKTLALLSENIGKSDNVADEAKGILKVLSNYSKALNVLDGYDHQTLKVPKGKKQEKYKLTYKKAKEMAAAIKSSSSASGLMGLERDKGLESIVNDLYQTFGREDVYPSVQEKAANLLYLVTKNHCFVDGNKRIAAGLFIAYLQENNLLKDKKGLHVIDDNTLAALTLMVATSNPKEKDMMVKIITNLIQ